MDSSGEAAKWRSVVAILSMSVAYSGRAVEGSMTDSEADTSQSSSSRLWR